MNLRKATSFLLLGLIYTLLHKLAYAVIPSLRESGLGSGIASLLWLIATSALILFAYYFLKEVSPLPGQIRASLLCIMACTAVILLMRLPLGILSSTGVVRRLLFDVATLGNAGALVVFVLSLRRALPAGSSLQRPLGIAGWAIGLDMVLGLVSTGYYVAFLVTGHEVEPPPVFQRVAVGAFLVSYSAAAYFLFIFRRIADYAAVLRAMPSAGMQAHGPG
jgi:hypothetical protein